MEAQCASLICGHYWRLFPSDGQPGRNRHAWLPLPVQTVDATPPNTLIRQCFPGRSDLFGCPRSKPSQGSVLVDLTMASDSGLCFQCKWGSPECCIDLLKPPGLPDNENPA